MISVDICICETNVRIVSNNEEFLDYAKRHFEPVTGRAFNDPTILVSIQYGVEGKSLKELETDYIKVCRGIYARDGEVFWNDIMYLPGLTIRFSFTNGQLNIDAFYKPKWKWRSKFKELAIALAGRDDLRNRLYFGLMYNLVYYPLFWILKSKDIHVFHGGAVSLGESCIVIAGAQGTGKSTLITHLIARMNAMLLSDNMLLYDQEKVYACHEPLRINEQIFKSLPEAEPCFDKLDLSVPLGRSAYVIKAEKHISSAVPGVFVVPEMSSKQGAIIAIPESEMITNVRCLNSLADEVRMYDVFDAGLCYLKGGMRPGKADNESMASLVNGKRCYRLQIKYGDDPSISVERLISVLS